MAGYLGAALMGLASGMSAYDEKQKKDAQAKQQQDLENQRIAALTKSTNQQKTAFLIAIKLLKNLLRH